MALLLEEIEQDEPAAHPLDEVTSHKDSQTQQLQSPLEDELSLKLRLEANA